VGDSGLRGRRIVCFSTADWDTLLPTNKHQLMRRLAERGNRVLFIETLGTRAPSLSSGTDVGRLYRRLMRGLSGARKRAPRLWTLSPLVRPAWGSARGRLLNRIVFGLQTLALRRPFRGDIAWVYSPYAVYLLDAFKPSLVVYHLVDDLAAVPGADRVAMAEAESAMLARADVVFCTEQSLYDRVKDRTRRALFMPNVADYSHFRSPGSARSIHAHRLATERRPVILFSGNLAHHKVDFSLLANVARSRPDWLFVLVGPLWEKTSSRHLCGLDAMSNVLMTGHVPYEELPSVLHEADVLLIPYLLNDATTAVFPLKFFEYMGTGKPTVATSLPSLLPYRGPLRIADSVNEFVAAIEDALAEPPERAKPRRALARRQTWERRLAEMAREIASLSES
jgi:glycosyltransferase involved in cell wall biosynthesis